MSAPASIEDWIAAPDLPFMDWWRDLGPEERGALPEDVRARAFRRFNDLTPYIDATIAKAERMGPARVMPHRIETAPPKPLSTSPRPQPLNWHELAQRGEPPPRRWALPGWIGMGHITLLVGAGGIGKTLLTQQTLSALALGSDFIEPGAGAFRSLMWMCEDDADEAWRRQVPIAAWLGVELEAFADRFYQVPRAGEDNVLATSEFGRLMFTPRLEELREQAHDLKAQLVVLDNAAQIFGGGENDRHAVTAFMNALVGALRGMAILLLAHPARAAGSEYSGSSAWEAAARTRLFLGARLPDEVSDGQDEGADAATRVLARRKANYAAKDLRRFRYEHGVLLPESVPEAGGMLGHLRAVRVERTLLAAARRLTGMGVRLTDGTTSPQYLPRLVLDYKLAEGATKRELADALRTAVLDGRVRRVEVGKYANRAPMFGLEVAP